MNGKKKSILVVSGGSLPLPPVKGGAIECLVDYLFTVNESCAKYKFYAAGIYDKEAVKEASKYKNTEFIFIRQNNFIKRMLLFMSHLDYKLKHKSIRLDYQDYAKKVLKHIKKNRIDVDCVVIENNVNFFNIFTSLGCPVFFHLHNDILNSKVDYAEKIVDGSKGIITVTNFIAEKVGTIRGGYNKTKVLLNCTDVDCFKANKYKMFRKRFRDRHHIKETDVVLIFAGRLHPTKGVKELLQAFNQIDDNSIYLLIVGGDYYSTNNITKYIQEIKEIAERKRENIIWTGYIDSNVMPGYYASADIGVFPSTWEEPGSIAVLEAEATGLPLIASRVGGIPENSSEETTIYVSVDDRAQMIEEIVQAIKKLATDSELRKKMREASLKYVENRDKYNYFENFAGIIEEFED